MAIQVIKTNITKHFSDKNSFIKDKDYGEKVIKQIVEDMNCSEKDAKYILSTSIEQLGQLISCISGIRGFNETFYGLMGTMAKVDSHDGILDVKFEFVIMKIYKTGEIGLGINSDFSNIFPRQLADFFFNRGDLYCKDVIQWLRDMIDLQQSKTGKSLEQVFIEKFRNTGKPLGRVIEELKEMGYKYKEIQDVVCEVLKDLSWEEDRYL